MSSYRTKELNVGDTVTVVFSMWSDEAVGRTCQIIAVHRGLIDQYVLEMDPPLLNGNKAIVVPAMHVKVL